MLKTTVLLREITNLSDARYGAGMGVDMLGFCPETSQPSYISPQTFAEMMTWVTGVKICLEITENEDIKPENYQADCLLLGKAALISYYRFAQIPLLLLLDISDPDLENVMADSASEIDFFVLENRQNTFGSQEKALLEKISKRYPIFLSFGFEHFSPTEWLAKFTLAGFALKGSPEQTVGLKDFTDLADILEALEVE